MTVMSAAVPYRQRICVSTKSNRLFSRVFSPHGDNTIASHMRINLVWMQRLQVLDYIIMRKLLVSCGLRMLMQLVTNCLIVGHSFIICSR